MTLALSLILLLQAKSGLSAWDTGKSSTTPLNLEARGGWTAVELPSSADVMKRDDPAPRAP